jgi:hypothetical protein
MSIPCPKCGYGFSRWRLLWLTRLFAFSCTSCQAQIAITMRGRVTMWLSIFLGFAVGALLYSATGTELAWLFGVGGVYVLGALLAPKVGTIGIYAEGNEPREG